MIRVTVEGGTNAGSRIIRQPKTEWTCKCRNQACPSPCDDVCLSCVETRKVQPASLTRCPRCGTRRP